MIEQKERDGRIDFLKGVGILLVIVGHLNCHPLIKSFIYLFHMPLFFIISGYLFDHRSSFRHFIKKKAATLLYPYFVFGGLYIVYEWLLAVKLNLECDVEFWRKHLFALVYGNYIFDNNADYIGVLWFLICLFWASLIYKCIVLVFSNSIIMRFVVSIGMAICGCITGKALYAHGIRLPWCLDIAFPAVEGVATGDIFHCWIKRVNGSYIHSPRNGIIALFFGLVCGAANIFLIHRSGRGIRPDMLTENYGSAILFFTASTLLVFSLSSATVMFYSHGKSCPFIERCGTLSMLIMIVHLKVLKIIEILSNYSQIRLNWIVLFALVFTGSYLIAILIERKMPFLIRWRKTKI